MKVVLDTNILISAAIARGKPRKLLLKALAEDFILLSSNGLLRELANVISRPKFRLTPVEKRKFTNAVRKTSRLIKVKSNFKVVEEDPDDDKVLNLAYDGRADYIVSGDPDLLNLKKFRNAKIVTASAMLEILEGK